MWTEMVLLVFNVKKPLVLAFRTRRPGGIKPEGASNHGWRIRVASALQVGDSLEDLCFPPHARSAGGLAPPPWLGVPSPLMLRVMAPRAGRFRSPLKNMG